MKAPAFQLYSNDFLVDTLDWSIDEVGIYTRLLFYQWTNGKLPSDHERLARIAGCSLKKFDHNWKNVSPKFVQNSEGYLQNLRLEEEREKQRKYSESRSNNVSVRYRDKYTHVDTHDIHKDIHIGYSSSSSSSSIHKNKKHVSKKLTDEEYFEVLKSNPAYKDIDIDREKNKCEVWCLTANKIFSRRRFVNWLNRAEKPMQIEKKSYYVPPEPPVFHEHEPYDPKKVEAVHSIVNNLAKTMEVKE